jgi:hypothetical protein
MVSGLAGDVPRADAHRCSSPPLSSSALHDSSTTVTAPAGWTLVDSTSNGVQDNIYDHVAGNSEPASYTWTVNSPAPTLRAATQATTTGSTAFKLTVPPGTQPGDVLIAQVD